MSNILIEKLQKEIESFEPDAKETEVGIVRSVGDGIAEIEGLPEIAMGEIVVFDSADGKEIEEALSAKEHVTGLALNLEEDVVRAVILGDTEAVHEGMRARRSGTVLSLNVSEGIAGRVVDPLGTPIDGKGAIASGRAMPIERASYGVIDRAPVDTPVHTGIKAIDALVPIGRGQRELIIGDRTTGKTSVAVDTILNQLNEPKDSRPICVYVAIGQKESKVAKLVAELESRGALEYTVIVSAGASRPAAMQFLAPFAGASIGEYFMDEGKDAVVIYDDLSKHAVAYRQMSLLLRRPPGREAYPGDIFYLHSRLLERAAKLNDTLGGGSLTALPIIETQEGDVSAYIPTNVISITDGQIYLDRDLFNKGIRPAIHVGLSVSRVGSSAQTKAMKKVAGKIRLGLAQYRELEAFAQFAQDLDEGTKKQIESGRRFTELLTQKRAAPLAFERQVAVVFASTNGYLDAVAVEEAADVGEKLLAYIEHNKPGVFESIRGKKEISDQIDTELRSVIESFLKDHLGLENNTQQATNN